MKNPVFVSIMLSLLFSFFSTSTKAGHPLSEKDSTQTQSVMLSQNLPDTSSLYTGADLAGLHLQKAGQAFTTGGVITILSTISYPLAIAISDDPNSGATVGAIIGGTGAIIGVICYFLGSSYIKKAGAFLENANGQYEWTPISVAPTSNGMGLVYRF